MKMKMERKMDEIKKGPWKAEEDEVLINHVERYGPRDWSSIRSKGLLHRTGKSCRLRWVNKLRPNLKNGCKFSAEEEMTVIELQRQFGNKWARIATYLPGRTDNDVKNFWSSRQKRIARIIHNSNASSCSNAKSHRFHNPKSEIHVPCDAVTWPEVTNRGPTHDEVPYLNADFFPSPYSEPPEPFASMSYATTSAATDTYLCPHRFPQIPQPQQLQNQPQTTFALSPDSQELLARLDDHHFYDILGPVGYTEPFPLTQPFFEPSRSCRNIVRDKADVFLDDLPADMFDQVDSVSSPLD